MSGPSDPAEFFTLSSGAVKYRWQPPDGVSTTYVPAGYRCLCCLASIESMSAPDSGNSVPSPASSPIMSGRGMSRSMTASRDGPQEIPMLNGARDHQSRIRAGEVVAMSCQLPRNAGCFPSATQGNTCQPRSAAASADSSSARSARVTSATLTLYLFLENVIANREISPRST